MLKINRDDAYRLYRGATGRDAVCNHLELDEILSVQNREYTLVVELIARMRDIVGQPSKRR